MLLAALISGCSNLAYYAHLARGQYQLLTQRVAIADIVAAPSADGALKARLQKVSDARAYAAAALGLPDNGSYTAYADLGRPYVVWNVLAAPELTMEPVEHCFLLVGCLAYRGYFDETLARAEAARLRTQGLDVEVAGVPAYSTLGWFDDPVLSSMLHWDDEWLIGTLFHELAHQRLYIQDDTAFNESFASFVEAEGLRQYLAARGGGGEQFRLLKQRQQQFIALALGAREQLVTLYASGAPPDTLRRAKQAVFTQMRRDYEQLRDRQWGGWTGYERWFAEELNNARLVPFALYDGWVPSFAALFQAAGGNWSEFYSAARALGALDAESRAQRLQQLKAAAPRN